MAYRRRRTRMPRHRSSRFSRGCPQGMYFNRKEGRCKPHEPSYTRRRRDRAATREEAISHREANAIHHAVTAAIYATSRTPVYAVGSSVRRPVPVRTRGGPRAIAEPYLRLGYGTQRSNRPTYYGRSGSYTTPRRGGRGGFASPFPRPYERTPGRNRRRHRRHRSGSSPRSPYIPYI